MYGNLEKLAYRRQLIGAGLGAVTGGGVGYLGSSRGADEDEGRFRSRRLRNALLGGALGGALGGGIGHAARGEAVTIPMGVATRAEAEASMDRIDRVYRKLGPIVGSSRPSMSRRDLFSGLEKLNPEQRKGVLAQVRATADSAEEALAAAINAGAVSRGR